MFAVSVRIGPLVKVVVSLHAATRKLVSPGLAMASQTLADSGLGPAGAF